MSWCKLVAVVGKRNTFDMVKCHVDPVKAREAHGRSEKEQIERDGMIEENVIALEKL